MPRPCLEIPDLHLDVLHRLHVGVDVGAGDVDDLAGPAGIPQRVEHIHSLRRLGGHPTTGELSPSAIRHSSIVTRKKKNMKFGQGGFCVKKKSVYFYSTRVYFCKTCVYPSATQSVGNAIHTYR